MLLFCGYTLCIIVKNHSYRNPDSIWMQTNFWLAHRFTSKECLQEHLREKKKEKGNKTQTTIETQEQFLTLSTIELLWFQKCFNIFANVEQKTMHFSVHV